MQKRLADIDMDLSIAEIKRGYGVFKDMMVYFLDGIASGDFGWAYVRLIGVCSIAFGFLVLVSFAFDRDATTILVNNWRSAFPVLEIIPSALLRLLAGFFTRGGTRFFLFPFLIMSMVLMFGARYIEDVYEIKSFRLALRYLLDAMFGLDYPRVVVEEGKIQVKPFDFNPMAVIGGPGQVIVRAGNVVVLERVGARSEVRATGAHEVNRFAVIKEIIPLEENGVTIDQTFTRTRDGIRIEVENIRFFYRLKASRPVDDFSESMQDEGELFDVAALNMTYRRSIAETGRASWFETLRSVVVSTITDWISEHTLDQLTAPFMEGGVPYSLTIYPRMEIRKELLKRSVEERLARYGAELRWFDIGHFKIPDEDIDRQRVEAWQAKWKGLAELDRVEGEAKRQAETAKAWALYQTSVIQEILDELAKYNLTGGSKKNVQRLILISTSKILGEIINHKSE